LWQTDNNSFLTHLSLNGWWLSLHKQVVNNCHQKQTILHQLRGLYMQANVWRK